MVYPNGMTAGRVLHAADNLAAVGPLSARYAPSVRQQDAETLSSELHPISTRSVYDSSASGPVTFPYLTFVSVGRN
jgi:hypothetical protein